MGRWIDIASRDGGTFAGYLATPPRTPVPQKAPGLVLVQEIWGVNDHIRQVCDQYASDGFVVVAPDVFWRIEPRVDLDYDEAGTAKAFALRKQLDLERADDDMRATADALRAMDEVDGQVAITGYCMGGMLAYRAASNGIVDCAVAYYGGGIQDQLDRAASSDVPIAFHFGGQDAHIPETAVDAVRRAFEHRDEVRLDVYPDAGHGFNCWGRPSYHRPSALLAHGRSLAFLATHLA